MNRKKTHSFERQEDTSQFDQILAYFFNFYFSTQHVKLFVHPNKKSWQNYVANKDHQKQFADMSEKTFSFSIEDLDLVDLDSEIVFLHIYSQCEENIQKLSSFVGKKEVLYLTLFVGQTSFNFQTFAEKLVNKYTVSLNCPTSIKVHKGRGNYRFPLRQNNSKSIIFGKQSTNSLQGKDEESREELLPKIKIIDYSLGGLGGIVSNNQLENIKVGQTIKAEKITSEISDHPEITGEIVFSHSIDEEHQRIGIKLKNKIDPIALKNNIMKTHYFIID